MTHEEIKKIAEEYAAYIIDPLQIDESIPTVLTISKESAKKTFAEMYIPFLQFLTERYYLVEKGKINELKEICREVEDTSKTMWINTGVLYAIQYFFGSEIGKEDGDE